MQKNKNHFCILHKQYHRYLEKMLNLKQKNRTSLRGLEQFLFMDIV